MLLGVEIEIPAALRVERFVCAPLDDASGFDHENLFGAPNGGQTMRDDERRAPFIRYEAFLDDASDLTEADVASSRIRIRR